MAALSLFWNMEIWGKLESQGDREKLKLGEESGNVVGHISGKIHIFSKGC